VASSAAQREAPLARPEVSRFASAPQAVRAALDQATRAMAGSGPPAVVAFGELHQTRDTARIPSALDRFTRDVLPAIAGSLSYLVVETWVSTGRCGQDEHVVTAGVDKTTERPAETEDEITRLLRRSAHLGVLPRILEVSCADYAAIRGTDGAVDYDRVLRMTGAALDKGIHGALAERAAARERGSPRAGAVAVYGGALHNDLAPLADLAPYSFGPDVLAATLGRAVEIDLIVPEYAERSPAITAEPWWGAYRRARRRGKVTLLRRGPRSFVVVFAPTTLRRP
jgi:hypothetical protein